MRIALAAAALGIALLVSSPGAGAAGLSGAPFFIVGNADGRTGDLKVAGNGEGEFVALYAYSGENPLFDFRIFARRFDPTGRPKGGRIEVFDNADGSGRDRARPTGWLHLKDGRSLATFWTPRSYGAPNEAGGHRGQIISRRTLSGDRFSIDRSSPAASPVSAGGLEPMNAGRGLAIWLDSSDACDCMSGRFISSNGALAQQKIDLSDGGLQHVSPYREGFVATFVSFVAGKEKTFAQIYDGDGREAAGRRVLLEGPVRELFTTETIGLSDGSLLVQTREDPGGRPRLVAQAFDSAWNVKTRRKTLRNNILGHLYSKTIALPDGGFLSAVHVRDGADGVGLELTRYSSKLRAVGAAARIPFSDGEALQVVLLENGYALAVYRSGKKILGQLVTL